jgi:hypothetical protein
MSRKMLVRIAIDKLTDFLRKNITRVDIENDCWRRLICQSRRRRNN